MGAGDRSRLENKLHQEAIKMAKTILVVLEAEMLGRLRTLSEQGISSTDPRFKVVEREFAFVRKQILDEANNHKRVISAVLKRFEVEEPNRLEIQLTNGSS